MRSIRRHPLWSALSGFFRGRNRPSRGVFRRGALFRFEGMEDRILLATKTYAAINLINSSGQTADSVLLHAARAAQTTGGAR